MLTRKDPGKATATTPMNGYHNYLPTVLGYFLSHSFCHSATFRSVSSFAPSKFASRMSRIMDSKASRSFPTAPSLYNNSFAAWNRSADVLWSRMRTYRSVP